MKCRVSLDFSLDEVVEAENSRDAFETALCQYFGIPYFQRNEITDKMYWQSEEEKIEESEEEYE